MEVALHVPRRSVVLSSGAYSSLWLLAAADTFLARHLLTAHSSGLYVAASTAASIALFMPNNVTLAVFPALAGDAARGQPGEFKRALGCAGGLTVLATTGLALLPALIIAILFGPSYRGAAAILVLLAFSNGAQGLVGFLQHHQLAHHRSSCLLPWLGLATFGAIAITFPGSPTHLAAQAVCVSVALLGVMAVFSLRIALLVRARTTEPEIEPDDLVVSFPA